MDRPMKLVIHLPYLKWRDGRPRWEPNARMMKDGWKGCDLKRPDGRWFAVEECEPWVRERMKEVTARRASIAAAAAAGKRRPALRQPRAPSLADLIEAFTGYIEQQARDETKAGIIRTLADRTIQDYTNKLAWFISFDPDLAATPAAALSPMMGDDLYQRLRLAKGDHMAPAVIRCLSLLMSWAIRKGRLPAMINPFKALKMKTAPPRTRAATPAEIGQLVAAADALGRPEIGDCILLGVWTGQRQNDRLALTEDAIGHNSGRMRFRQQKTGARVSIPPAPQLRVRLDAARDRRRAMAVAWSNVVIDETTGAPFKQDWYRKVFSQVRTAAVAGIEGRLAPMPSLSGFRDQDLRDTAVTWLALATCDYEQIRAITGHTRESILGIVKHYIEDHEGFADAAIGKMTTWYEKETG
ncbi:MAG: hypothetical protein LCH61_19125 [Proteobacteria bacterium]|nr:hypothetical protein [Pseudomonadota bacterium]